MSSQVLCISLKTHLYNVNQPNASFLNSYFNFQFLVASTYFEPQGLSTGSRILTFICLRATILSYDVAHRAVRSWRQNSFGCFSHWPWNTLRNYICGVSLVAGRSGGKRYTMRGMERGFCGWGVWVGKQWTEKESFQHYVYNRYKIVVYTGLRSNSIKNHASRNRHRWR
jgi:hypothetical protein